jgi:hypothetical protein
MMTRTMVVMAAAPVIAAGACAQQVGHLKYQAGNPTADLPIFKIGNTVVTENSGASSSQQ